MKKVLSIVLAIAMMLSIVTPVFAANLNDIKDSDYKAAIERLVALGVIEGYEDGTYLPKKVVTRAEMAKLLVVCLGLETSADLLKNSTFFNDVPTSHWANGFIGVASQYGLIKGDGDGNFRPDDTVNYAEAVTMCLRALGYSNIIEKAGQWPTNYLNKSVEFKLFDDIDYNSVSDGANRESIAQLMWNMLNNANMWNITQENEKDGAYSSDTGKTMLDTKFPDYKFDTFIFDDWNYDIEDDEYVVTVSLDNGKEAPDNIEVFEYAANDFYTFVPGTEVEVLTYKNEDAVSIYATDENHLAEGTGKELSDKYEDYEDNEDVAYAYLLLSSDKKTATVLNGVEIYIDDAEIVTEVKENRTNTKYTVDYFDYQDYSYTIDNDEVLEDGYLTLKNGERISCTDLKEDDVYTWVSNNDQDDDDYVIIVNSGIETGSFDGLKLEVTTDEEKISITIDDKEYNLYERPMFFEMDKDGEETKIEDVYNVLSKKEKDNDYLGKDVTAYFDAWGNIVKVVFEYVEAKSNATFYLAVDGEEREVVTKDDTQYYAKLESKSGASSYLFEDNYNFDFIAGELYWVEFNNNGEIEEAILVEDGEAYDDNALIADAVDGEYDDDTKYVGGTTDGYKVTSTTTVYSIIPLLDDEDEPTGEYKLEITTGPDALDGIDGMLVLAEDEAIKASYVIVDGEAESTDKLVGIFESYTVKNSIAYATISGDKYELDDDSIGADVGSVVAFTINDDEATIIYQYKVSELPDAGEVTKVDDEIITIDEVATEDVDLWKETFEDNDVRVFVITVDYNKDDEAIFDSVEEIEIDAISIKKGDFVAIDEDDGYFAIIKGYDGIED